MAGAERTGQVVEFPHSRTTETLAQIAFRLSQQLTGWVYEFVDGEVAPFLSLTRPSWEGAITITPEGGGLFGVERADELGRLTTIKHVRSFQIVPDLIFERFWRDQNEPLQAT